MSNIRHDFEETRETRSAHYSYVVRISLSAARRRRLADMAREAGQTADELASRLLAAVIDEDGRDHDPQPAAPPPAVKKVEKVKLTPRKPTRVSIAVNGIVIDFAAGTITHQGKTATVSPRYLAPLATLARVKPNLMGHGEIARRTWPNEADNVARRRLEDLRSSTVNRLASIGLALHLERGIGLALKEICGLRPES